MPALAFVFVLKTHMFRLIFMSLCGKINYDYTNAKGGRYAYSKPLTTTN